jgi:hypothetical protein
MAKLIIHNESTLLYPIISDSYANIDNALDIWMKFTSYLKPEELLFIDELKDKNISSISQSEMDKYNNIRKQIVTSELLVKYKNKECTQEEHNQVVEFMHTYLKKFIKSRLTEEALDSANIFIETLETEEQLKKYINLQEVNYMDLNIYNAYVLFIAKEKLYYLQQKSINEKIRSEQFERAISLKRSLVRDYGHKF